MRRAVSLVLCVGVALCLARPTLLSAPKDKDKEKSEPDEAAVKRARPES
jgi:hypothetical protein